MEKKEGCAPYVFFWFAMLFLVVAGETSGLYPKSVTQGLEVAGTLALICAFLARRYLL